MHLGCCKPLCVSILPHSVSTRNRTGVEVEQTDTGLLCGASAGGSAAADCCHLNDGGDHCQLLAKVPLDHP